MLSGLPPQTQQYLCYTWTQLHRVLARGSENINVDMFTPKTVRGGDVISVGKAAAWSAYRKLSQSFLGAFHREKGFSSTLHIHF
jgi:hypothetical protein